MAMNFSGITAMYEMLPPLIVDRATGQQSSGLLVVHDKAEKKEVQETRRRRPRISTRRAKGGEREDSEEPGAKSGRKDE
jgi:hypothetical protein